MDTIRSHEQAQEQLNLLRSGNGGVCAVGNMRSYLLSVGATAEDIGTTNDELDHLQRQAFLQAAQGKLDLARTGDGGPELISAIMAFLKAAGSKPGEIRTSDHELQTLESRLYRQAAIRHYRENGHNAGSLPTVQLYAARAGVPVEEIMVAARQL